MIKSKKRSDIHIQLCTGCGQKLRFPDNIGGMLMACPQCGQKFQSDFKLSSCDKQTLFTACEQYVRIGFVPRLKIAFVSLFSRLTKTK